MRYITIAKEIFLDSTKNNYAIEIKEQLPEDFSDMLIFPPCGHLAKVCKIEGNTISIKMLLYSPKVFLKEDDLIKILPIQKEKKYGNQQAI